MKISNKRDLRQIASNHSSDTDFKDFMKLYKDYTKEPYSFLVNDRNNHWRCSVKKVSLKILQLHRKTSVPESLFQ